VTEDTNGTSANLAIEFSGSNSDVLLDLARQTIELLKDIPGATDVSIEQEGPRILTAIEKALGLPSEATALSREVLALCGNMSSATVLFLLDRLRARRAARPCIALGFGPGLVVEAMLLR
jgi:predicted naringenin-chalcone synthase